MTEEKFRLVDVIIKAITAFVAIGVAGYGLLQYVENTKNNRATQIVEQEKISIEKTKLTFELNRQKSEILSRAAQAAADATWTSGKSERLIAINKYTRLFVGELSLVANTEVIAKGDALNERLAEIKESLDQSMQSSKQVGGLSTRKIVTDRQKMGQLESEAIDSLNEFVDAC